MLLPTNESGLLISCATPATILPEAGEFFRLNHAALRKLQRFQGFAFGEGGDFEPFVLFTQLLLDVLAGR